MCVVETKLRLLAELDGRTVEVAWRTVGEWYASGEATLSARVLRVRVFGPRVGWRELLLLLLADAVCGRVRTRGATDGGAGFFGDCRFAMTKRPLLRGFRSLEVVGGMVVMAGTFICGGGDDGGDEWWWAEDWGGLDGWWAVGRRDNSSESESGSSSNGRREGVKLDVEVEVDDDSLWSDSMEKGGSVLGRR